MTRPVTSQQTAHDLGRRALTVALMTLMTLMTLVTLMSWCLRRRRKCGAPGRQRRPTGGTGRLALATLARLLATGRGDRRPHRAAGRSEPVRRPGRGLSDTVRR